ncbi:hypothetical protein J2787_000802 [Chryseobacterium rhizosphaerae]|uniref:Uncharacterized protein n=1 Tax=Chryseobacterium rhizosphaerae TaxID=395937 RepID=A0AAE3Y7G9_9FLAO|nr:hypothetical protein [Chryseobacterium rhizosphaerae]MDR6525432.1 hypothetical protein [Chryseobacterium rhizosphaerae]
MDQLIRQLITEIILENSKVISIAVKSRNKFEGWLKFELASKLEEQGFTDVFVETSYEMRKDRYDLSFSKENDFYCVELKTPNTSWDIAGVKSCKKPITKNFDSIILDTKKLNSNFGLVAFVLFPIPKDCDKWHSYFYRIKQSCDLQIDIEKNCNRVNINFDKTDNSCDLIVCSYFSKIYNNLF